MNIQDFINKYSTEQTRNSSWANDHDALFWARSYKMPKDQLQEMSFDFLSIPAPLREFGSSAEKAVESIPELTDNPIIETNRYCKFQLKNMTVDQLIDAQWNAVYDEENEDFENKQLKLNPDDPRNEFFEFTDQLITDKNIMTKDT